MKAATQTISASECLLRMYEEHHEIEDYQKGVPRWCTGCGDNAILTAVQRLCRDEGLLPEKTVKSLLTGGLLKAITLPAAERAEWLAAIDAVMQHDLTRADVLSHFGVAADLIKQRSAKPSAYQNWTGRIIVLSAENDPTQNKKDIPRYEKLFGRPVDVLSLGNMGHMAALFNPDAYVTLLEQALV